MRLTLNRNAPMLYKSHVCHVDSDNIKKVLTVTGKLHVKSVASPNNGLSFTFICDKTKSSDIINLLTDVNDYAKSEFSKEINIKTIVEIIDNDTISVSIGSVASIVVSIKNDKKIKIKDIMTFKNFDCMISLNPYIMKTPNGVIFSTKMMSMTILDNKQISKYYELQKEVSKDNIIVKKYPLAKKKAYDNIINILKSHRT